MVSYIFIFLRLNLFGIYNNKIISNSQSLSENGYFKSCPKFQQDPVYMISAGFWHFRSIQFWESFPISLDDLHFFLTMHTCIYSMKGAISTTCLSWNYQNIKWNKRDLLHKTNNHNMKSHTLGFYNFILQTHLSNISATFEPN